MDPILAVGWVEVVVLLLLHMVLLLLHRVLVAMVLPGAHGKVDHSEGEVVVGESSGCIAEQKVAACERFLDMKTNACFVADETKNQGQTLGMYEVLAAAEVQLLRKH